MTLTDSALIGELPYDLRKRLYDTIVEAEKQATKPDWFAHAVDDDGFSCSVGYQPEDGYFALVPVLWDGRHKVMLVRSDTLMGLLDKSQGNPDG